MHSMVPDGFFGTGCPKSAYSKNEVVNLMKCHDCRHAYQHYTNPTGLPCRVCDQNNLYEPSKKRQTYTHYEVSLGVPEIKDVIFNPPATIVKWSDNTKTVVKTQNGEEFDPEKGLAMAVAKKAMGNKGSYYNHFKKWAGKFDNSIKIEFNFSVAPSFSESLLKASEKAQKALRAIAYSLDGSDRT